MSAEQWAGICTSLAKGKGMMGFGWGFSQAINEANRDFFKPIGCVACYAEYNKGQKAMVVLTEDVAKAGRAEFPVRTLAPSKYIMGMSGDSMAGMPSGES